MDHQKAVNPNVILGSCFSIQAVGIGVYIAFGVFFNPLMDQFGWPRAHISGASSLAFFISGLVAVYVGRLNDRIGPRGILAVTAVFLGVGLMLMYRLSSLLELYLFFGLVFGVGLSSIDVIALSTVARWFPDRRGSMTGITKVGTGAGQFVFPMLASLLIASFGWRSAFFVLGLIALISLSIIARLIHKEPDSGLSSRTTADRAMKNKFPAAIDLSFSQAARTFQLWILCITTVTIVSCLMSILVHIVPHGRDIGVSVYKASGVLSTIGAVSMAGRFATGKVIDRIGSKRSMVLSLVVLITGLAWLQTADTLWKLYVFACIYGLAHGGFFTVVSPIVAEFFGTRSHGTLFGLIVFSGTTGGAVGPIVTGYLFDVTGSYQLAFGVILAVSIMGLVFISLLKPVELRKPAVF